MILGMTNENENLINKIVSLMETDSSVDAPTDAIKWAKNIFRTRAVEPKKSLVQKVLAVLQIDLSPNKAAFGERSASGAQARQMLFQAGDNSIDLRIAETEKGFNLRAGPATSWVLALRKTSSSPSPWVWICLTV